ncbi:MAG TPA: chemotaxis protein CheW [Burkholderiaceae bacterium]|nr:chemotaxis protein CheW [Burkholderiaceae bacterium]
MGKNDYSSIEKAGLNDCWNRIGVRGDGSCPELQQYVHCRNCPVFSAAAAELLNGELPAEHVSEWTHYFAQPRAVDQVGTQSVVIFRVGLEWLGLPTSLFKAVVECRAIHALPHQRSNMILGMAAVRGELLVCVSLEHALGLERVTEQKRDKRRIVPPRLLVLAHEGHRIAFPVDEVHGTHRFHPQQLAPVPATVAKATVTYTKAILPWQQKSVGMLDEQLLFYTLNRSLA